MNKGSLKIVLSSEAHQLTFDMLPDKSYFFDADTDEVGFKTGEETAYVFNSNRGAVTIETKSIKHNPYVRLADIELLVRPAAT